MGRGGRPRGKRRPGRLLAAMAAGAGLAWAGAACVPPASFKAAKEPREGRVMNRRVAVVFSERYQIDIPGVQWVHPFDTRKYAKIYLKLNTEGLLRPADVFVPAEVSREDLLRAHAPAYLASLGSPAAVARCLEAPIAMALPAAVLDAGVLRPHRFTAGGTLLAARLALAHGIGVNLGGGYHHAKPGSGEGFCVYNDLAVAIRALQAEGLVARVLVVDLDVHQGNGTAECFAGDESVFTFSMHQGNLYPVPKSRSDLDVELEAGTGDAEFLALLAGHLPDLFARSRPDLVVLQAGADTLAGDPLAGLAMTPDGLVRRDALVIDECARRGVPVAVTFGGGYGPDSWAVQYSSVRRTIETYGLAGPRPYPPREPTVKEQLYAK